MRKMFQTIGMKRDKDARRVEFSLQKALVEIELVMQENPSNEISHCTLINGRELLRIIYNQNIRGEKT